MKKGWLIEQRKGKGYSQCQLAKETGFSQQLISKIENGACPSVYASKKIAEVLGFEWTLFFE